MRNLPRHYPHDNVYSLFPFCTPCSAKKCLEQHSSLLDTHYPKCDDSEYDQDKSIVHTLATKETISYVLNAPDIYHSPYGEHLKKITDDYGYVVVIFRGSLLTLSFL